MILLLEALHRKSSIIPLYCKAEFFNIAVCNSDSEQCMSNNCPLCCDGKLLNGIMQQLDDIIEDEIPYYQWEADEEGFVAKVLHKDTVRKLFEIVKGQLTKFSWHVYIKDKQSTSYEEQKALATMTDSTECVIQCDFAENYTTIFQDEIQKVHWKRKQVTIYTVTIWHKNVLISKVIVSDSLDHDKKAVIAYTSILLEEVRLKFPDMRNVNIWTDGPSSQFKNKYVFAMLYSLQEKYEVTLSWNFFATSHGKGPCDALGGNIKRVVHQKVLAGSVQCTRFRQCSRNSRHKN